MNPLSFMYTVVEIQQQIFLIVIELNVYFVFPSCSELEFLKLSRPEQTQLETLLARLLGRGLQFMLTNVSPSPSETIISVGNNWHGDRQFTPAIDVETVCFVYKGPLEQTSLTARYKLKNSIHMKFTNINNLKNTLSNG